MLAEMPQGVGHCINGYTGGAAFRSFALVGEFSRFSDGQKLMSSPLCLRSGKELSAKLMIFFETNILCADIFIREAKI